MIENLIIKSVWFIKKGQIHHPQSHRKLQWFISTNLVSKNVNTIIKYNLLLFFKGFTENETIRCQNRWELSRISHILERSVSSLLYLNIILLDWNDTDTLKFNKCDKHFTLSYTSIEPPSLEMANERRAAQEIRNTVYFFHLGIEIYILIAYKIIHVCFLYCDLLSIFIGENILKTTWYGISVIYYLANILPNLIIKIINKRIDDIYAAYFDKYSRFKHKE